MKTSLGKSVLALGACAAISSALTLYFKDSTATPRPKATAAPTDQLAFRAQTGAVERPLPPAARILPVEREQGRAAPEPAPSAVEPKAPPLTREQQLDREELAFYQDPGHSAWSIAAETEVKQRLFGSEGAGSVPGATLGSLECRRGGCRLEMSYTEASVADSISEKLTEVQSFLGAQIKFFWTDDSQRNQVAFVSTQEAVMERRRERGLERDPSLTPPVDWSP